MSEDTTSLSSDCCSSDTVLNNETNNKLTRRKFNYNESLQRMLTKISTETIKTDADSNGIQPLKSLTTRAKNDPAIALLDAWAISLDVLSFYQQRYYYENYLKTALELRSIRELARSISYELKPGVAASTYLAFTVDSEANNGTGETVVAKGNKVQSVPVQNKLPQTFETSSALTAKAAWNAIKPYIAVPSGTEETITGDSTSTKIAGINHNLQIGDNILLIAQYSAENTNLRIRLTLKKITESSTSNYTTIEWGKKINSVQTAVAKQTLKNPAIYVLRKQLGCFGHNAAPFDMLGSSIKAGLNNWDGGTGETKGTIPTIWQPSGLKNSARNNYTSADLYLSEQVPEIVAGKDHWIFLENGSTEQAYQVQSTSVTTLADFGLSAQVTGLKLAEPNTITDTKPKGTSISSKSTDFKFRTTTIYVQSDVLTLYKKTAPAADIKDGYDLFLMSEDLTSTEKTTLCAKYGVAIIRSGSGTTSLPYTYKIGYCKQDKTYHTVANSETNFTAAIAKVSTTDFKSEMTPSYTGTELTNLKKIITPFVKLKGGHTLTGTTITLPIQDKKLIAQKVIAITGIKKGTTTSVSEVATISKNEDTSTTPIRTKLTLTNGLKNIYPASSVSINANVVAATHGETVTEVLGSGDGSKINQSFTLKESPLTYLSAANQTGVQTTLEVRVNDVLWKEVPYLHDQAANSQSYMVRRQQNKTKIIFGDGIQGARLPSGQENIKATYRVGLGFDGNVAANNITLLQDNPLGVQGVTNPIAASGGNVPENITNARSNAPLNVLTLGRLVSLRDFENFAQAFAGIDKAQAKIIKESQVSEIYITVANAESSISDANIGKLKDAIEKIRNIGQSLKIKNYQLLTFNIEADIFYDTKYTKEKLEEQIKTKLKSTFSFVNRKFAQPVTVSEIVAVIQKIAGVTAVDLNKLYTGTSSTLNSILTAKAARFNKTTKLVEPAQLLRINDEGITLSMKTTTATTTAQSAASTGGQ